MKNFQPKIGQETFFKGKPQQTLPGKYLSFVKMSMPSIYFFLSKEKLVINFFKFVLTYFLFQKHCCCFIQELEMIMFLKQ